MRLQFVGWPSVLPALPATAFRVTPAGLVEWCGADYEGEADLRVEVEASNPALVAAQALAGQRPRVEVAGDAAFAADVDWLFDNLRWDVQDDLERIVGAAPAREIARIGRGVAQGMRATARRLGALAERQRPPHPTPPATPFSSDAAAGPPRQ